MKQLVSPNLDPTIFSGGWALNDWLGWCLAYTEVAFGADRVSATATDEWNRISFRHEDRNLPSGVYVPVWFSHFGTYNGVYKNWGHVAIYKDGTIWSSPISHKPYADIWTSIEQVEQRYNCKFIGWSEDIGNKRVVQGTITSTPSAGGDVITRNDVGPVRVVTSEVKGWDFNQVHSGAVDAREMNAWVGQPWSKFIDEAWRESEAFRNKRITAINYYDTVRPQLEQQIADLRVALSNEQAKPAKEVIKEVVKIVEKPVEVIKEVEKIITKSVYINDPILAKNTQDTLTIVKSIKGMLINFIGVVKNFIKKG